MNKKSIWILLTGLLAALLLAVPALAAAPAEGEREEEFVCLWRPGDPLPEEEEQVDDRRFLSSATEEAVRKLLYDAMTDRRESVDVSQYRLSGQEFGRLYRGVLDESPELFYVSGYSYSIKNNSYVTTVTLKYDQRYGDNEILAYQATLRAIKNGIDPSWSGLEILLYFHDYLVTHCEYDESLSKGSSYDALMVGYSVCQGYAEAFQAMCIQVGIPCSVVSSATLNHAWDMVTLDGENFFVDCTWDDPSNYWYEGYCQHENFLLSTQALYINHNSTDWKGRAGAYSFGDEVDVYSDVVTSSRYDGAWWRDVNTAIPLIGHVGAYTLDSDRDNAYLRNFSTDAVTKIALPGKAEWSVWGDPDSRWIANFCSFAALDGSFYFTMPTEIWSLSTKGSKSLVHSLTAEESARGYIYGIVNCGGTLFYGVSPRYIGTNVLRQALSLSGGGDGELSFPDAVFNEYMLQHFDTDGNGKFSAAEIGAVKSIDVSKMMISSLQGVERLSALESLNCSENRLGVLELSGCKALKTLNCDNNRLTVLDVSGCSALSELHCAFNQLTTLDLGKNTALKTLNCSDNQFKALDLGKNTALSTLDCSHNQLTALTVSQLTGLKKLNCNYNQLTVLNVSKNTALTRLELFFNQVSSLDLSRNTKLQYLDCFTNQLTTLNLGKNTALKHLECGGNDITTLNLSPLTKLEYINCSRSKLTALNVSKNTALKVLNFGYNDIKSIDLSRNTALTEISAYYTKLSALKLGKQSALKSLQCDGTPLKALDLSGKASLEMLFCGDCGLEELNVEGCTALYRMKVKGNQLTTLDVSSCPRLAELVKNGTASYDYTMESMSYGSFFGGTEPCLLFDEGLEIVAEAPNFGVGPDYVGLVEYQGQWVYVKNGRIDTSYTGLAQNENGWWYVQNGVLDLTYTGLATNENGTFYVYKGQFADWRTGCEWVNGEYCEFYKGQLTTWKKDATVVDPNGDGHWVSMRYGKVDMSYTGIAENENGFWYVKNGVLDLTFTGLVTNDYGTWFIYLGQLANWRDGCDWVNGEYCEFYKGQLTTWKKDATLVDPHGDDNWVSMRYGRIDMGYTGLADNQYGWWYVKDGRLNRELTDLVTNDYGTWYVYKGQLVTWKDGIQYVEKRHNSYYIYKGQLADWHTGDIEENGVVYHVVNGLVTGAN